ncbi:MAG: lipoyl synthase [Armatimonadia bacterium]|nr:lipoyl synthase [Armatimonadia bacterium]
MTAPSAPAFPRRIDVTPLRGIQSGPRKESSIVSRGATNAPPVRRGRMPDWLKVKTGKASLTRRTRELLRGCGVCTVCEEAKCPNIGECFCSGTATFMILGDRCTRDCRFCAVAHGEPCPPDPHEPAHVAEAADRLDLEFVVLTCVTRDDLPDGGAEQFVRTIDALRERVPGVRVEVLTSDFAGNLAPLNRVLDAEPTVYNHNVETIARLQPTVRPQADYDRSLGVLRAAREHASEGTVLKSGLMVGLGEELEEVGETLGDLADAGCSVVTIGQYLRPSPAHLPVARYVTPEEFAELERMGLERGLKRVLSGPFVRSSYRAAETADELAPA